MEPMPIPTYCVHMYIFCSSPCDELLAEWLEVSGYLRREGEEEREKEGQRRKRLVEVKEGEAVKERVMGERRDEGSHVQLLEDIHTMWTSIHTHRLWATLMAPHEGWATTHTS